MPTYNRYNLLKRSICSVLSQTYNNFELVIIDDSTDNTTYENIGKDFNDIRIKYIKNIKNSWVNFSRNMGIESLSKDIDYIVFLDDDDYFNTNCLQRAKEVIQKNLDFNWFLSNKKGITQVEKYNTDYNYFYDYFTWKKIKWDATHFIKRDIIWKIRFSNIIKQWQEWLFFIELWEKNNFFTYNFDSTISEYLPWWLSDQKWRKILINQCTAICEFFVFRKNSFQYKRSFLYFILQKIIIH